MMQLFHRYGKPWSPTGLKFSLEILPKTSFHEATDVEIKSHPELEKANV